MSDAEATQKAARRARRGQVIVVSGPTAVGKGTVVAHLRTVHPEILVSVSATTRPPRPGERDGYHYHFISPAEFDHLIATDGLLEWAEVHGVHRYGTPRAPIEQAVGDGRPVILEIDLQGARQVKQNLPDAVMVFLAPPSWDELVHRLVGRGTETPQERERRLRTAQDELAAQSEFDHTIVNREVGQAVDELVDFLGL